MVWAHAKLYFLFYGFLTINFNLTMTGISTSQILQLIVGVKHFITSMRFNAPHNTKILVAKTQKRVFIASLFLRHDICSSWIFSLTVPKVKLLCWMQCLFYLFSRHWRESLQFTIQKGAHQPWLLLFHEWKGFWSHLFVSLPFFVFNSNLNFYLTLCY